VRVPGSSDGAAFEKWVREISHNADAPSDDPGLVNDGWMRWLRRFFDERGPVEKEVVTRAAMEHQIAVASEAVRMVLADLHRTTDERPVVEVDVWMESSIRISIDGGFTAPSMWEVDAPEAFAEVADYLQDQLLGVVVDGSWRFWPECRQHNAGLHAEVHDGRAVWRCRIGDHEVAPMGQLGQNA
jgi:hypothetical protein